MRGANRRAEQILQLYSGTLSIIATSIRYCDRTPRKTWLDGRESDSLRADRPNDRKRPPTTTPVCAFCRTSERCSRYKQQHQTDHTSKLRHGSLPLEIHTVGRKTESQRQAPQLARRIEQYSQVAGTRLSGSGHNRQTSD